MSTHSMPYQEAVAFVKARRPIANPNVGFLRQLELYGISSCDMASEKGQELHLAWRVERDAAYAESVKGTVGALGPA